MSRVVGLSRLIMILSPCGTGLRKSHCDQSKVLDAAGLLSNPVRDPCWAKIARTDAMMKIEEWTLYSPGIENKMSIKEMCMRLLMYF